MITTIKKNANIEKSIKTKTRKIISNSKTRNPNINKTESQDTICWNSSKPQENVPSTLPKPRLTPNKTIPKTNPHNIIIIGKAINLSL